MALFRNEKGQISIFFSASLVVLVSIVAFVINVGLFVKAKINLQNATDAAAFAGAAVQARQLSKIAHLNWEMRNIYKEFLYKYYVVGNLNIRAVSDPGLKAQPGQTTMMDFTMEPDNEVLSGVTTADPYNIPSVCIHLENSKTNICRRYAIPGLPEFGSSNLPGAEAASRAFQDALITTKVNDCVERTRLNMFVTSMWAYNVQTNSGLTFASAGPAIMADRQGAWPKAVELAMRIRNLEKIVNRAPDGTGICVSPGTSDKISCSKAIDQYSSESLMGNERVVKAFYSGFRNVGGSFEGDEMKNSFTLTELPVNPLNIDNVNNASVLLIPADKKYPKYFLDLKLMMVNYAIFYSAMIPRASLDTSGACDVTKAAIPVPGYPLGFYKNPDVLTYYAVKGEAVFEGMFNPFNDSIKLTTYAAAKPMGGRIGPILFHQEEGQDGFKVRNAPNKMRSVPYLMTFDIAGVTQKMPQGTPPVWTPTTLAVGDYAPGVPMPVNVGSTANDFWLTDQSQFIGGKLASAGGVMFGVPNLVYDFFDKAGFTNANYTDQDNPLFKIQMSQALNNKVVGLYSRDQYARFRGDLSASMSADALNQHVARVRAATLYEIANYLVPVPWEIFTQPGESPGPTVHGHFGQIVGAGEPLSDVGVKRYKHYVYAPLYGAEPKDLLFTQGSDVLLAISDFMRQQETGIKKFRDAMNTAAKKIKEQADMQSDAAKGTDYTKAAAGVSDIWNAGGGEIDGNPQTCKSLAGVFQAFYYGDMGGNVGVLTIPTGDADNPCPKSLYKSLQEYFAGGAADPSFSPSHYLFEYSWRPGNFDGDVNRIFSGYMPGPYTGVPNSGIFSNLAGISETMRRNFYSTKLIKLNSLRANGGYTETGEYQNFSIHSEGGNAALPQAVGTSFQNVLVPPEDTSHIKH